MGPRGDPDGSRVPPGKVAYLFENRTFSVAKVQTVQNDERRHEPGLLFQIVYAQLQLFRAECLIEKRHYEPQRLDESLQIGDLALRFVRKDIFEQFLVPEFYFVRNEIRTDMENRLALEQISYGNMSEAGSLARPGPGQEIPISPGSSRLTGIFA